MRVRDWLRASQTAVCNRGEHRHLQHVLAAEGGSVVVDTQRHSARGGSLDYARLRLAPLGMTCACVEESRSPCRQRVILSEAPEGRGVEGSRARRMARTACNKHPLRPPRHPERSERSERSRGIPRAANAASWPQSGQDRIYQQQPFSMLQIHICAGRALAHSARFSVVGKSAPSGATSCLMRLPSRITRHPD